MALFNYATKEITIKIVYYGPGLSGKTTNLQHLHSTIEPERRGKLLSLATETDRTLFFDLMPVTYGKIKDFSIRFQVYTVPGQVRYNSTRKILLKGADAIVFVADSQKEMRDDNIESFGNMRENLSENNINPDEIPVALQYNKRDLEDVLSEEELDLDLNSPNYQTILAEAINGKGVMETYQAITRLLIKDISKKHHIDIETADSPKPVPAFEPSKNETPAKKEAPPPETYVVKPFEMPAIETKLPETSWHEPPIQGSPRIEEAVAPVSEKALPAPQVAAMAFPPDIEALLRSTTGAVNGLSGDVRELSLQLNKILNLFENIGKAVSDSEHKKSG